MTEPSATLAPSTPPSAPTPVAAPQPTPGPSLEDKKLSLEIKKLEQDTGPVRRITTSIGIASAIAALLIAYASFVTSTAKYDLAKSEAAKAETSAIQARADAKQANDEAERARKSANDATAAYQAAQTRIALLDAEHKEISNDLVAERASYSQLLEANAALRDHLAELTSTIQGAFTRTIDVADLERNPLSIAFRDAGGTILINGSPYTITFSFVASKHPSFLSGDVNGLESILAVVKPYSTVLLQKYAVHECWLMPPTIHPPFDREKPDLEALRRYGKSMAHDNDLQMINESCITFTVRIGDSWDASRFFKEVISSNLQPDAFATADADRSVGAIFLFDGFTLTCAVPGEAITPFSDRLKQLQQAADRQ